MFRLIAVTLAALYAVLHVFGDETRRPEVVARSEPLSVGLIQAAYLPVARDVPETTVSEPSISDAKAIQTALDAGAKIRAERKHAPLRGFATDEPLVVAAVQEKPQAKTYWVVTGTRVNLRSGPGTSNAVVGQVTQGVEAEMLADRDGWYEIRTADGATSGWIFGKFLRPG